MKISISQYSFSVREPYSEGTELTLAEAQALNRLRAENIRNNLGKQWAKTLIKAKGAPSLAELEAFREKVAEYDLEYKFAEQVNQAQATIETEIEAIVLAQVEEEIRLSSIEVNKFEYNAMLAKARRSENVLHKAQHRLKTKQEIAAKLIDELSGGIEGIGPRFVRLRREP